MSTDREEAATGIIPETVVDEMHRATQSLRDQAWKMNPPPVISLVEAEESANA